MRPIYLDYNATTPVAPSVVEAMLPFLSEHYGNPSSQHVMGIAAHRAVEDARERVASLLGCDAEELLFTSGGTESNNLAILGTAASASRKRGHVIISAVEHPAVVEPIRYLERRGHPVTIVPVNAYGQVAVEQVEQAIRDETILVSIMHANNEIGTLQPLTEISEICDERGIPFHADAAQSVGKVRTHVEELGVDLMTLAGHKMYAPKGIGVLYIRRGTPLRPVMYGAGHEQGLRPGTENVAAIVGLGQAARLAQRALEEGQERIGQLRDHLWHLLREGIGDELTYNGPADERLPNTLSVNFPRVVGSELLQRTSHLYASTGAACHSGSTHLSATLSAIGLRPDQARGTIRLSLGWMTSHDDIERAAEILLSAWDSLAAPL